MQRLSQQYTPRQPAAESSTHDHDCSGWPTNLCAGGWYQMGSVYAMDRGTSIHRRQTPAGYGLVGLHFWYRTAACLSRDFGLACGAQRSGLVVVAGPCPAPGGTRL